jgi:hypothetical protein
MTGSNGLILCCLCYLLFKFISVFRLSQITLPDLDAARSKGCRGGDEYAVVEGILGRRFPIYPDAPSKSKPTGKMRQIQYKLHPREAGWLLKVDKVMEF